MPRKMQMCLLHSAQHATLHVVFEQDFTPLLCMFALATSNQFHCYTHHTPTICRGSGTGALNAGKDSMYTSCQVMDCLSIASHQVEMSALCTFLHD